MEFLRIVKKSPAALIIIIIDIISKPSLRSWTPLQTKTVSMCLIILKSDRGMYNRTVLKHLACNDMQLCIERTRLMRVDIRQSNNSRINSIAFFFLKKWFFFQKYFQICLLLCLFISINLAINYKLILHTVSLHLVGVIEPKNCLYITELEAYWIVLNWPNKNACHSFSVWVSGGS